MTDTKEYLIDKEPVTWKELIQKANEYEDQGSFSRTSVAAKILRDHGHVVENNPVLE